MPRPLHHDHRARAHRWTARALCAALVACCAWQPLAAQDPPASDAPARGERVYEQTPFDQVVLKEPEGEIVKIEPLSSRKLPTSPAPTDKLEVHLAGSSDVSYEIAWRDIVRVEFFEQVVLNEARALTKDKKFDEAFDYYRYLRRNYARLPGLEESMQDFLASEADAFIAAGEFERGYALLVELDLRNHDHPRLADGFGKVMDKLIGDYVAANNSQSARGLVARFAARFKDHPVAVKWQQTLSGQAADAAAKSAQALGAGQKREAYDLARRAVEIWPQEPTARQAMETAHAAYPFVSIGVLDPAPVDPSPRLDDWAGRRVSRLLSRPLFELTGVGAEGGIYKCPWGEYEKTDLGLGLNVRLRPDARWSDGAPMTAADLARFLVTLADRRDPHFDLVWRETLSQVNVLAPDQLDVRLRRAHVLVESLLSAPLVRREAAGEVGTGPFVQMVRRARETAYAVPQTADAANRPREIVERTFLKSDEAIAALLRGEIAALDRVNPWDLAVLSEHTELNVASYAWPTVHCLIPNASRPLTSNRTFRRALVYIINRESILKQQILRGRDDPGSLVVSGPFVKGVPFDDPRGYANDGRIEPRASEPQLAMTLAAVAISQVFKPKEPAKDEAVAQAETPAKPPAAPAAAPAAETPPAEAPTDVPKPAKPILVLVHPANEVARVASASIARYIALLGVEVKLHEQAVGAPLPAEWDLLYTELAANEPVADAWRLFGPGGLAAGVSPYMELALRELSAAADWTTARSLLLEIHGRSHDDVAIVPLWQLNNYCAWHQRLSGVGEHPVTLYQNVDEWRVAPWYPVETF